MEKDTKTSKPSRKKNISWQRRCEAFLEFIGSRLSMFMRLPLLLSLTRRALVFFVLMLFAEIVLFFSGNIQNFLDDNLSLILFAMCCCAIGAAFFAFAAIVECIYYIVSTKKLYFCVHLVIFVILLIVAVLACLASGASEVLSRGIKI